jgi:hypothetical protein
MLAVSWDCRVLVECSREGCAVDGDCVRDCWRVGEFIMARRSAVLPGLVLLVEFSALTICRVVSVVANPRPALEFAPPETVAEV